MQIKDEGNERNKDHSGNNTGCGNTNRTGRDHLGGKGLNDTGLSSTFKSMDLPPKEYEAELQHYEGEVRNHIKIEQQLKLHIEVLNERIEEFDKEKEALRLQY